MHHIPIPHHVVFSFQPHFTFFLGVGLALAGGEIIIADDFGADETMLVGMNGR